MKIKFTGKKYSEFKSVIYTFSHWISITSLPTQWLQGKAVNVTRFQWDLTAKSLFRVRWTTKIFGPSTHPSKPPAGWKNPASWKNYLTATWVRTFRNDMLWISFSDSSLVVGISFTPRESGDHYVSVKRLSKHITGSPFKIMVGDREVGDAKKVSVTGKSLREGTTHTDNTFNIDTRKAGYGGLSLSIEGPSKAEIKCTDNEDATLDVSYRPTEPGYYIMNLKFADHHVEGSPFTIKVFYRISILYFTF